LGSQNRHFFLLVALDDCGGFRLCAASGSAALSEGRTPVDLTGYWVSVVTNSEQRLFRMATPNNGGYRGIGLTLESRKLADSWDPAKDEVTGEPCKAYGVPAIMHVSGHLHIT